MKYSHPLLASFIVGIALFSTTAIGAISTEYLLDTSVTEQSESKFPIRLMIPAIGVDASIESLGLTPEGMMGAPKNPASAGWYNLGVRPGEIGSAAIDGHSGWKNNEPALFDELHRLKEGHKVYVEDSEGEITIFVVRELRVYDSKANASDVFFSVDGKSHLNLITCTGIWNETSGSSSERLVIFTDREDS